MHPSKSPAARRRSASPAQTTQEYVVRFWPRLLSYYQQTVLFAKHGPNTLVAPKVVDPTYRAVVAINDDTLYTSAFVDVTHDPVLLEIPHPGTTFSLLVLDVFGNRIDVPQISVTKAGSYALVPQGWHGKLAADVVAVPLPYAVTIWNIRADKYSDGVDRIPEAEEFRRLLHLGGQPTQILPVSDFDVSVKLTADELAEHKPKDLLDLMVQAVHDATTRPNLDGSDLDLAHQFDAAYAAAVDAELKNDPSLMNVITAAVGDAWSSIQSHWLDSAGETGWIHPTNFADWGTQYLDRASGNEFIQYGNDAAAAGYWHTFVAEGGHVLNGAWGAYRLRFPKDRIPDATRFWSLTAYTPDTIELIPGSAKYVVASYTPDLAINTDGSITVYISQEQPPTVPKANWLPVSDKRFNIMLRVYGPTKNTDPDNRNPYVPPPITRD